MANSTPIDPRLRGRQSAGGFTPVDLQAGAANLRGPQPRQQTTPTPAPKGNSRGERNNNPGNLEDGAFARSQPGYAGSDGRFARFNTSADGEAAQVNLLRKNYKGMSVAQIIQKYAPVRDNSEESVRNYIGYVASRAGLNPDAAVSDDHLHQVAAAMRAFETGKRGKIQFKPYAGQIRASSQRASGPNPGRMNVEGTNVPGPSGAMNTGVSNQSGRIMNAGPVIERKQQNVESRVAQAGSVLDDLLAQMSQTQASQIEAKQTQVNTVRAINEEMTQSTQQMIERTKPVFQRQQAIADKMIENQSMSPIARAVRGFFDLNYNDNFLMNQMQKNNAIIEQVGQTYRQMQSYQADAINQSETLYQLRTAMPGLQLEHLGQKAKAAEMSLQQAQTDLDVTIAGVKNEVGLISAQNAARTDLLSRIDSPTALSLLGQAEQSGDGVVLFQGIPLSSQELRERAQQIERFDDSVRMSKLALANGEADLADKQAARMVEYATTAQIDEAIANGGVMEGVQIAPGVLTNEKAKRVQAAVDEAEILEFQSTPLAAAQTAMGMATYSRAAADRMTSIFGPNVVADEQIAFSHKIRDISNQIRQLGKDGDPVQLGVLRQQLIKAKEAFDSSVQAKALRLVGGDKESAAYVTSYMMGDRPTPQAAASMMVHFASRGGLPGAIESSPFSRGAMEIVMDAMDEVSRTPIPGTQRMRSQKQVEAETARQLADPRSPAGKKLREKMTGMQFTDSFRAIPEFAKAAGHPFGNIDGDQFRRAVANADSLGFAGAAYGTGVSGEQLKRFMEKQPDATLPEEKRKELESRRDELAQRVSTYQQKTLVSLLDQMERASPSGTNSQLLQSFLSSREGSSTFQAIEQQHENGGFLDWMAGTVSRGGLSQTYGGYTSGFGEAVGEAESEYRTQALRLAQGYRNDVNQRTGALLRAAGLTREESIKLGRAIGQLMPKGTPEERQAQAAAAGGDAVALVTQQATQPGLTGSFTYRSDLARRQIEAVDQIILSHKFDDPDTERLRKEIAKDWKALSSTADNFIDGLIGR